ncbi:hypothetical protein RHGRI_030610 [Rhododendron griersonianum]|uniref:Uncharacterized protein n=1 Tax=Rhododendron griersonianum TaxID=479676 RepID=A0AAV6I573_9ERIC|nr:hypothetical protein RHGRI_030610 [Rhododendron griersonianum]
MNGVSMGEVQPLLFVACQSANARPVLLNCAAACWPTLGHEGKLQVNCDFEAFCYCIVPYFVTITLATLFGSLLPQSDPNDTLNTSKAAIVSPQAEVLADSEVELEKVLVGVVSSSHESLNQLQDEVPNQQLPALVSSEQQEGLVLTVSSE